MTRRVIRRDHANRDVDAAIEYYASQADLTVAQRYVDALNTALRAIADGAAMGSPRYGELLGLSGLRHWKLKRFPYFIFYVDRADEIDVWRILHASRDIPVSLAEPDE